MWTYEVARVLEAPAGRIEDALASLAERLWPRRSRVVATSGGPDHVLAIDAGPGADDPEVWLTWRLAPLAGGTLVTLVLDEVEEGADPTEGLQQLLDLVEQHVVAV
jgi:hypothetical protein